jgi:abortive infection bacteriophage resistance protein
MAKVPYQKPALSYTEQLTQLKERGLAIENEPLFLELLEKKSYYRLSGYWYPLLADKQNHVFKEGSNFNQAYSMYCFDRDLRQLIIKELEEIEVAVRAKMIYIFSHQFGPFWYRQTEYFKKPHIHSETLEKIRIEFARSDAQFIQAFKRKYTDDLPPSWTAFEIISFGVISRLFSNAKPGKSKRQVADFFGLDDRTFSSWLHGFVYVRNICAHHSRLWNRVMRIQPMIPITPKHQWLNNLAIRNDRTYFILSMILYLLRSINESNSVLDDFKGLLRKYPNIHTVAMGFPSMWEKEPLWNEL